MMVVFIQAWANEDIQDRCTRVSMSKVIRGQVTEQRFCQQLR